MSKAEESALEAYPKMSRISEPHGEIPADNETYYLGDVNAEKREAFIKGYHQAENDLSDKARLSSGWDGFYYGQGYKQAEKDLELTWRDMEEIVKIANLLEIEWLKNTPWDGIRDWGFYEEALKRFKEFKERK